MPYLIRFKVVRTTNTDIKLLNTIDFKELYKQTMLVLESYRIIEKIKNLDKFKGRLGNLARVINNVVDNTPVSREQARKPERKIDIIDALADNIAALSLPITASKESKINRLKKTVSALVAAQ